jgi:hypothetical protein
MAIEMAIAMNAIAMTLTLVRLNIFQLRSFFYKKFTARASGKFNSRQ